MQKPAETGKYSNTAMAARPPITRRARFFSVLCLLPSALCVLTPRPAPAAPSQQDVFKSIHDNVGQRSETDSRPLILFMAGGGAIVLLVLLSKHQKQREPAKAKTFNHHGKLLREVLREVPLKPAEMKQLKVLSEAAGRDESGEAPDPLTLLLCPSVLSRALKSAPEKVDRKTLAQMVRKMGLSERA